MRLSLTLLLRFEDENETVGLHLNTECPEEEVEGLVAKAIRAGAAVNLPVVMRGRYELCPDEENGTFSYTSSEGLSLLCVPPAPSPDTRTQYKKPNSQSGTFRPNPISIPSRARYPSGW